MDADDIDDTDTKHEHEHLNEHRLISDITCDIQEEEDMNECDDTDPQPLLQKSASNPYTTLSPKDEENRKNIYRNLKSSPWTWSYSAIIRTQWRMLVHSLDDDSDEPKLIIPEMRARYTVECHEGTNTAEPGSGFDEFANNTCY